MECEKIYISLIKEKLEKDGEIALKVHGGSMRPFIKSGSVIKIQNVKLIKNCGIKIGDVVLYEQDGRLLMHRVIKILRKSNMNDKIFLVAGDNRIDTIPHTIKEEEIIGIFPKKRLLRLLELYLVIPINFVYTIARFIKRIYR
jgi:signal peptidase I